MKKKTQTFAALRDVSACTRKYTHLLSWLMSIHSLFLFCRAIVMLLLFHIDDDVLSIVLLVS